MKRRRLIVTWDSERATPRLPMFQRMALARVRADIEAFGRANGLYGG